MSFADEHSQHISLLIKSRLLLLLNTSIRAYFPRSMRPKAYLLIIAVKEMGKYFSLPTSLNSNFDYIFVLTVAFLCPSDACVIYIILGSHLRLLGGSGVMMTHADCGCYCPASCDSLFIPIDNTHRNLIIFEEKGII